MQSFVLSGKAKTVFALIELKAKREEVEKNINEAGDYRPATCIICRLVWHSPIPFTIENAKCPNCGNRDHIIFRDVANDMRERGIKPPRVREEVARRMAVNMNPVTSSNIGAIGYDGEAQVLHVQFTSGRKYAYFNVPLEVYDAFLSADSKGKYFAASIRGKYQYSAE